ncbi:MAG: hypothetical protein ACXVAO_05660 [Vulcanimicrobiaceae bacterium]
MMRCTIVLAPMIVLATLLAGCSGAPARQAPIPSRSGSVNVRALLHAHPLFSILQQYDREIATLRATNSAAPIQGNVEALGRDFDDATVRVRALTGERGDALRARERNATSALLNNAQTEQNYDAQYAAVHREAIRDMGGYRDALLRQERVALSTYAQAVDSRTRRAYAARAQEFNEREASLALQLAKRNAEKRLRLRIRLANLYHDAHERAALKGELAALDAYEGRIVDAQRRRDAAALSGIRTRLYAQAASDYARMSTAMRAKTAANLAARRAVLQAQSGGSKSLQDGKNGFAAPNTAARIDAFRGNGGGFGTDLSATIAAFGTARADLSARFTTLADTDDASRRTVMAEAAALERERQTVRAEIVAQIMRYARKVAGERGLRIVYAVPDVPQRSIDLTPQVRRELARLPR